MLPPDSDGMVGWRPVPMDPPADFAGIPLHSDIREFYSSYWGGHPTGRHSGESVSVRLAWNAEELADIRQFVAEQVAAGEPVFVANTDSDLYFGVDNATGEVWLCEPGCPPIRQVSPSLAEFLAEVQ